MVRTTNACKNLGKKNSSKDSAAMLTTKQLAGVAQEMKLRNHCKNRGIIGPTEGLVSPKKKKKK